MLGHQINRGYFSATQEMWIDEFYARGGCVMRVGSNSMKPWFDKGWHIKVKPVKAFDLAVGDIVVFDFYGTWVSHRVIAINSTGSTISIVQKGDYSLFSSEVQSKDILGRVTRSWNSKGIEIDFSKLALINHQSAKFSSAIAKLSQRKYTFPCRIWRLFSLMLNYLLFSLCRLF